MTRSVIDKVPLCTGGYTRASVTPSSVSLTDKDVKAGSRGVWTGQPIIKAISGLKNLKVEVEAATQMIVNLQVVRQIAVAMGPWDAHPGADRFAVLARQLRDRPHTVRYNFDLGHDSSGS